MELHELTLQQLIKELEEKKTNAQEIMTAILNRINAVDQKVKAFLTLNQEAAIEKAREFDRQPWQGKIAGIPFALKDNYCTKGVRTTCASKMLENFIPPYDATLVKKLYAEGGILTGKLNLDEFAMGSSTELSAFFPSHNPWDLERVPGGSSGGSAAAVAADEIPFSLASDTGGSIRQPAAYCGVVGLKPTYGRVSRWGIVAYASSLDQAGVITKDVSDAALVLSIIAGYDPLESTSVQMEVPDYTAFLNTDIKGLKIGYPKEYFQQGVDGKITETLKKALLKYEEMGAHIEEVSLPHSEYALPAYYIIGPAEASSNMGKFDGVRYGLRDFSADNVADLFSLSRQAGFGPEVKRRIMLGTYALSSGYYDAYYLKALKVRRLINDDFAKVFSSFDVIVAPTTPTTAFKIGENTDDILTAYMNDILTVPINMAGLPGISIPCGLADGLPVGMQIIGKPFAETTLLKAAYAFEQATDYHQLKPSLGVR
ncbi:MAG TPA: Asp-tRNA(Asn)/Glu-tRNA(Gln) amidotransferase subunit GatA [Syntrophomonadaceae bacterium]|nr:Asp-tRNA(Asn)/Glu-tRNA(Gln) amidotransferase subunit GatA [Syntrophomonadaceae bacterium]HRX21659.1 Asp-tRNA(Asn)/Glu-tRNA(Gln) amidotransferase subunit GatA [Syntrophomonadaceae bacterium]